MSCGSSARKRTSAVVVGIYHGIKKTFSVNDFFAHLVAEATTLEKEGFVSYGKTFSVASYGLLCNMPARGFVISVKEHIRGSHIVKARFYGCHKYETKDYTKILTPDSHDDERAC
ncbi:hypothetical protein OUZ56_010143 [Daphnia magna]|uniref:Uncharacterized protein n=1 Tax=Daphnia magna TaxID=35525 RepID=A0ABR0AHX4_9CRUS|nr:hypothetical protein OUZ56_010143 [Daphnia magna]